MKKINITLIIIMVLVLSINLATEVSAARVYTVKTGDTLWTISQKLGITVESIIEKNKISNPTEIHIGQKLLISGDDKQKPDNKTSISYTVKSGDLLWKLAERYNIEVADIIKANNIQYPYYIYIGQSLIIPVQEDYDSKPSQPDPGYGYTYHTIQAGEILWTIARDYDTTVQKLVELNDIENAYDLYIGRRLIVPGKTTPEKDPNTSFRPYVFYQVEKNDRLWKIAENYGVSISTILRYNQLKNTGDIQQGQLLVIPLQDSSKLNYLKTAAANLNQYYRVRGNEDLENIADYFQIPEEGIRAINGMKAVENVYTGQRLLMPLSSALFVKHELYTIKTGGEYIYDIAFEKGVSINSILRANYLRDPNAKLSAGQVIVISLDQSSKATWIEYENGRPINSIFN
ncbi:MAG TPA: LysM peptidoglycan-binding domain-containing protein [Halanaerobiales bacterium]|nr:LysM peptidoglycan-binding domain-containing protein [Halanaerobiales bacterium]